MTTTKMTAHDAVKKINALKCYRSGWANDIREGWKLGPTDAKEILYQLYEISGSIILAMENRLQNDCGDKMAMHMTHDKLTKLVKSELFDEFSCLGEAGFCRVVTSGTKHHIRVMFECLEILMA